MRKRIVIKLGTNVLTANAARLNRALIHDIAAQVAALRRLGWQVALVTSGAVGAGREVADLSHFSNKIVARQMYAAIGQSRLMHEYEIAFRKYNLAVGQALITREDFQDRGRYENYVTVLKAMLVFGAVPIINENDVISVHELSFGDNDLLAAATAIGLESSYLILLTNQEGLLTDDPKKAGSQAVRIPVVKRADESFHDINLSRASVSTLGVGGMLSKVNAAQLAAGAGVTVWIANGLKPQNISDIVAGKDVGTKFLPQKTEINAKDRWILCSKNVNAAVVIDKGAVWALKSKKSLLMVGVKDVLGSFAKKEIIEVLDEKRETIALGVANYPSDKLIKALSAPRTITREVIHVDNLRLL